MTPEVERALIAVEAKIDQMREAMRLSVTEQIESMARAVQELRDACADGSAGLPEIAALGDLAMKSVAALERMRGGDRNLMHEIFVAAAPVFDLKPETCEVFGAPPPSSPVGVSGFEYLARVEADHILFDTVTLKKSDNFAQLFYDVREREPGETNLPGIGQALPKCWHKRVQRIDIQTVPAIRTTTLLHVGNHTLDVLPADFTLLPLEQFWVEVRPHWSPDDKPDFSVCIRAELHGDLIRPIVG